MITARQIAQLQKSIRIRDAIIDCAMHTIEIVKQYPQSKYKKNIFVKSYHRRPNTKGKTAALNLRMGLGLMMCRSKIFTIMSQPLPRFPRASS